MKKSFVLAVVAVAAGYGLADSYISRLPDHRGLFVVPVQDSLAAPLADPPRHTVVVVIDGLRLDGAEKLSASATLREKGQCFTTDVGMLSVSRPVYAELSTGLEQDRTGARNNDETSPLQVQSIWQLARENKRSVAAVSALDWWRELFPSGFDSYRIAARDENIFAAQPAADITLLHPTYVDETAHTFGAASPEYKEAAARVDREVAPFLRQIDWQRDLVLFTADHGHRDRGGHGAPSPEIEFVLTCVAGQGVSHNPTLGVFETRAIAPLLSVLLGLPFPRDMRAGDDTLDRLWPIVANLPASYLAERQAAVTRFRRANEEALRRWGEPSGSWQAFYAAKHFRQHAWWVLALALTIIMWRKRWRSMAWMALVLAATVALEIVFRGSFDVNAINQRAEFIRGTLAACVIALAFGAAVHRRLSRESLRNDCVRLVILLAAINLSHIFIYGWPLGFPLPEPLPFFVPFVSGVALVVAGTFLAVVSWRRRA